MAHFDWNEIADQHNLSPADRRAFFIYANSLGFALSGRITPTLAGGADALLDLPIQDGFGAESHVVPFRDVHRAANPKMQAALDDLFAAYKEWLKLA